MYIHLRQFGNTRRLQLWDEVLVVLSMFLPPPAILVGTCVRTSKFGNSCHSSELLSRQPRSAWYLHWYLHCSNYLFDVQENAEHGWARWVCATAACASHKVPYFLSWKLVAADAVF